MKGENPMVYINLRLNLEDYGKWRAGFDANDAMRRAGGSTGVYQVYRDVDNPNSVSLILEWEDAKKAQAFLNDPALKQVMQAAGVIGAPVLRAVQSRM
jgi:quinol monooxygenase YgiN